MRFRDIVAERLALIGKDPVVHFKTKAESSAFDASLDLSVIHLVRNAHLRPSRLQARLRLGREH